MIGRQIDCPVCAAKVTVVGDAVAASTAASIPKASAPRTPDMFSAGRLERLRKPERAGRDILGPLGPRARALDR